MGYQTSHDGLDHWWDCDRCHGQFDRKEDLCTVDIKMHSTDKYWPQSEVYRHVDLCEHCIDVLNLKMARFLDIFLEDD